MDEFLQALTEIEADRVELSFEDDVFVVHLGNNTEIRFISYRENPGAIRTPDGFSITVSEVEIHRGKYVTEAQTDEPVSVNVKLE